VYLTGKQQQFDFHYIGETVDVWANIRITRIGDEILGTFTDITQIKTLQLQLEQNIEELKRSNVYLGEFAHAASHDLKEPIRKIHTFAERLHSSLHDRMNEVEASVFERMQMAAKRMNLLVEDLLTYSHVSETPLQMEEVDMNEKFRIVLSDLEVQIEEKKAVIHIGQLPTVKGYRRQLQQLFQNLLGNALKYSKKDTPPQITIRAQIITGADAQEHLPAILAEKRYHLIEVQDNGIGFEQQYAERIFSMFQRLHGRSEYEGTGIGLSIARKVVENHQGHIWATGKPGEGATFQVLLPA
jgi:light-regulated signal transduction histidine kinase (bacteriophytochrome)